MLASHRIIGLTSLELTTEPTVLCISDQRSLLFQRNCTIQSTPQTTTVLATTNTAFIWIQHSHSFIASRNLQSNLSIPLTISHHKPRFLSIHFTKFTNQTAYFRISTHTVYITVSYIFHCMIRVHFLNLRRESFFHTFVCCIQPDLK